MQVDLLLAWGLGAKTKTTVRNRVEFAFIWLISAENDAVKLAINVNVATVLLKHCREEHLVGILDL